MLPPVMKEFFLTSSLTFSSLMDAQKASWDALCAIEQIDTTSGVAKSREAELFGSGTTTRSNLQTLRSPDCSRGVELGLGTIDEDDVAYARTL